MGQFLSERKYEPQVLALRVLEGTPASIGIGKKNMRLRLLQSTSYYEGSRWSVEPTLRE